MLVLALLAAAGGCGNGTVVTMSPAEAAQADIGPRPDNYQSIIRGYFDGVLKDPYSAHYAFTEPVPGKLWRSLYTGYAVGWLCLVGVNARNSFGGYTGRQAWGFILRDGRIAYATHGR